MLSKQQANKLTFCVCVFQAVSEEQQPGLKGRKGKEEKSKGKAKVREYWQEECPLLGLRN